MNLPFVVDLKGRVAVVTGGSGVLCSLMARALAACGARVAILGRSLDKALLVAEDIGDAALALSCDVTDLDSLRAAKDQINQRLGPVSILINGAGGNRPGATTKDDQFDPAREALGDFFSLDPRDIREVMDLNYLGSLLPAQVFAPEMMSRPGACIVNISSMAAYQPMTRVPAYAGVKAAINNLTQWLATYFAKAGLRVNAIAPGFFLTEQNRALLLDEAGQPSPRTRKILAATPMGRLGQAEELIGALLFLVSEQASGFVTGVTIPVDGGFLAYSGV